MKKRRCLCALLAAFMMVGAVPAISDFEGSSCSYNVYAAQKLSAPTGVKVTVSGSNAVISWNKVSGADGYRVYVYDRDAKAFVRLKTITGNKTSVKDLESGKHYFKIAAVEKVNGKYVAGNASEKVTANVKKASSKSSKKSTEKKQETNKTPASTVKNSAASSALKVAKDMGQGWNLGNTMEATGDWISGGSAKNYEKAWGQPITTKKIITEVKNAGFDSVRIPVAWSNMMSTDGKYTINKDYFDRVDEIVGYVLDNDMYCIINIHWDGGWWEDFGSSDAKKSEAAWDKYKAMWTQIAKHYKNYSDKLIFESANEELGSKTKGASSMADSYNRVNEINQTFVDIVRKSGGKNDKRYLLIAGYDTDIDKTCNAKFKMPEDTVDGRLLVSVHYYTPSTYCIADNPSNSWGYKDSWGTEADKAEMKKYFEKMKKFTDDGYGVIIGEYGVCKTKNGSSYEMKKGTADFFAYVDKLASDYGYCAMLWDCSDWFNRHTCKYTDDSVAEIYKD